MVMRVGVYVSLLAGLLLAPVLLCTVCPVWAQEAESAVALTLREAVDMALRRIERSSVKIAEFRIAEERGSLWPTLALRGRYTRDSSNLLQSGNAVLTGNTLQRYGAELALNYNLLEFLAAYPRMREAQAEERAELLKLQEEEANIALRTSDAYLRLLAKWEAQRALEALREEYREFFRRIDELFKLQVIPAIDHTRARAQMLAIERELLITQSEAITAELELRRYAGLRPDQAVRLVFEERDVNVTVIKSSGLAGLLASAQEANPRLLTAEAAIVTARWKAEEARSAYYPTLAVSVTGGYGRDELLGEGASGTSDFRYNVTSVLSIPLFDGGVRRARLAQATAKMESKIRDANRMEVEVKQLIEDGYWTFVEKGHERDHVQQQLQLGEEELKQARERITEGITSVTDVLNAFARLARLRQEFVHIRSDALLKGIRLTLAVGWYPFTPGTSPQGARSEPVASWPGANPAKPVSQTVAQPELPVLKETFGSTWQSPEAPASNPSTPANAAGTRSGRPVLKEVVRPAWQPQAASPYTPVKRVLPPPGAPANAAGTSPERPVLKEVVRPAWQPQAAPPGAPTDAGVTRPERPVLKEAVRPTWQPQVPPPEAKAHTSANQAVAAPELPDQEEGIGGERSGRSGSFTVPSAVRGLHERRR